MRKFLPLCMLCSQFLQSLPSGYQAYHTVGFFRWSFNECFYSGVCILRCGFKYIFCYGFICIVSWNIYCKISSSVKNFDVPIFFILYLIYIVVLVQNWDFYSGGNVTFQNYICLIYSSCSVRIKSSCFLSSSP